MTAPLCFIDTETTGVHPERQVWEVAMIRREESGRELEVQFFVDVDLEKADPFGLKIGGFYERHPQGRWLAGLDEATEYPWGQEAGLHLDKQTAARLVARLTHGSHLVGAVPNFDAEVLAAALRWQDLTPGWHYHLVDVEALAVGFLNGRYPRSGAHNPPWSSDELSKACGVHVPEEERHTALGDARWARALYDAVIG